MPAVIPNPVFSINQVFVGLASIALPGGKLFTYAPGTTTLQATYDSVAGTTPNANPIILDTSAPGKLPVNVYLTLGQAYKFVLTKSDNTVMGTWDYVYGGYPVTIDEVNNQVVPVNYSIEPGNVLRYGAASLSDISAAVTSCLKTSPFCYFPRGTYTVATTVNLGIGKIVYGESETETTINSPASIITFLWLHNMGLASLPGPTIHDLKIRSDFPIVINDKDVQTNDTSGNAACMNAKFYNLDLAPITINSGRGITATKLFDSIINNNLISGFLDCIFLIGCDINKIESNRIQSFSRFGIIEQSTNTDFGSQNSIHLNDILISNSDMTGVTYIKSCSRHVSITDNYLEKTGGTIATFIDATKAGCIVLGPGGGPYVNVPVTPLSIVIRDNRIDGEGFATSDVYKIDPTTAISIICDNRSTSGNTATSSFTSNMLARYSSTRIKSIRIKGPSWGIWDGFDSKGYYSGGPNSFYINGSHLSAIVPYGDNQFIFLRGEVIVIPQTFPTSPAAQAWLVPNWSTNPFFASDKTYTATVIARSLGSGDSLKIAMASDAHTDGLNIFLLSQQFKSFCWSFRGNRPLTIGWELTSRDQGVVGILKFFRCLG